MALMDKQHMRGTNEQTESIWVALMGSSGAHAWHRRVGTEHTCDTGGQSGSTSVALPASRHMRVSAGQSPSRSRCPGRAAPSHPPGAHRGRPRLRPLGAGAAGPRPDRPRSPRSGGARSRGGTAAAAGRGADAEGGGAERGTGAGVRPLSPAPGAGRTAAAPGPGLGRGAALPVRRDKPQPLRSTEGAAGRSRSWRRVADPPPPSSPSQRRSRCPRGSSPALRRLGRCPPPPPPARPAAHVRPRPAGPLSGTGTGTRAHRHPLARLGRSPPRSASPVPGRTGPYGRGAGKRGGEGAAQPGERIPPEPGRGEQLPRDRGLKWVGGDPSVAARPL